MDQTLYIVITAVVLLSVALLLLFLGTDSAENLENKSGGIEDTYLDRYDPEDAGPSSKSLITPQIDLINSLEGIIGLIHG